MANKKTKGAQKAAKAVVAEAPSPAVKRAGTRQNGRQQSLTQMPLPEAHHAFVHANKKRAVARENVYGGRMQATPDAEVRGARDVSEF